MAKKRSSFCAWIAAAFVAASGAVSQLSGQTPDVNARYMYRVPDWLWTQQQFTPFISSDDRAVFESDIKAAQALSETNEEEHERVIKKIAQGVAAKLALRDLAYGAPVVACEGEDLKLAIQLDPEFTPQAKQTLLRAVELFLSVALDDEAIDRAIATSVDEPEPKPEMYVMEDGAPKKDVFGNLIYTDEYQFIRATLSRPADRETFKKQLRAGLCTPTGEPAVLIISQYAGNVWWGGGYIDHVQDPVQRLRRLDPSEAFLYIRLNSDKLKAEEPHFDDPVFWASKIGHEILHNIGYYHPPYADPADRDMHNNGDQGSFLVKYERELYRRLSETIEK